MLKLQNNYSEMAFYNVHIVTVLTWSSIGYSTTALSVLFVHNIKLTRRIVLLMSLYIYHWF